MGKIRVGINGYGTIGRRVAGAVIKQHDMKLVGVTKRTPDYRALEAVNASIPLFALNSTSVFRKEKIPVEGVLADLMERCDIIVDCAPKGLGAKNKGLYVKKGVKAVFQGGERHDVAECSFNSQCNYDEAVNKNFVRVVSCNTTALCRVLQQLGCLERIVKARVAIVRRSSDPDEGNTHLNAWVPKLCFPSHHASDVRTVLQGIQLTTLAGIAPMSLMHGHMVFVEFSESVSMDGLLSSFLSNPRIWLIPSYQQLFSTARIKDSVQRVRQRGDVYEVCVWSESIGVEKNEVGMHIAVDQQAIVVPECIDAVRAMFGTESSAYSTGITNKSLGIGREKEIVR